MRKNSITFDKPAFHQTRIGRTVIGGAAAILTAGAYWAFAPEEKSAVVPAPVAASASVARQPIKPFDPVYDQITSGASAPVVAPRQSPPATMQPGTASFITLYPDVLSALQQLQRDDLECAVQRYTTKPTADGLVSTIQHNVQMVRNNTIQGCNLGRLQEAFENAAEATINRRTVESPLGLNAAQDMVYPPALIQVTATQRGAEDYTPVASYTLVCQQDGTVARNNLQFRCHLGPN